MEKERAHRLRFPRIEVAQQRLIYAGELSQTRRVSGINTMYLFFAT